MNLNKSITSSVYVVFKSRVLLHRHKKYKTMFPLGGHMEPNEVPQETAIREVLEESGLSIQLYNSDEKLELGRVKQLHKPMHMLLENVGHDVENIDFIYFATTNDDKLCPKAGESEEFYWFSKEEIEDSKEIKPHVKEMALEALDKLGELTQSNTMDINMYTKGEVIDYLYQYSRYYSNLLMFCDIIAAEINPQSALINLFNIIEMVFKSKLNDYEINLFNSIEKLKKEGYLTEVERDFLNNKENGIRSYRNKFAHANLIKYNLIFEDEPDILYPLTEYSTCERLYNDLSPILFNLILKVAFNHLYYNNNITLDNEIKKIKITIKEISPEEILHFKGMDKLIGTKEWSEIKEADRYRLAENSGDVYAYYEIFKQLFKDKK